MKLSMAPLIVCWLQRNLEKQVLEVSIFSFDVVQWGDTMEYVVYLGAKSCLHVL